MEKGFGLEFAHGTTPDCKRLVGKLFQPGELLGAYILGRQQHLTSDLVLVTSEADPSGFEAWPRADYVAKILGGMDARSAATMRKSWTMAHRSAHEIAQLPREENAWWLVIARREALPPMAVMFASRHEVETTPDIFH